MLEGWRRRNSREWEQTRVVAYNILAVNRDPKKSFPTQKEYMPLLTDDQDDDEAEGERLQRVMDEYKAKLNH